MKTAIHSATVDQQLQSDIDTSKSTAKVLIIYTGGTLGMRNLANHGYVPVPNHLHNHLSSMIQFHDPLNTYEAIDSPLFGPQTDEELRLLCKIKSKDCYLPALKTPPSLFGKHILYSILEYDPLLDSSNLSMDNWQTIAKDISDNYHLFDGFLIVHGTDTMSYTASALSFMLENLGKTVILTGSQIPLAEVRNDAVDNLLGALTVCGHYLIPEVSLYFDNKLFRGNRTTKVDTMDFDAFGSPNCPPLVTMGVKINVNWPLVWKPIDLKPFQVHTSMSSEVACLRIFPGISGKTIDAFVKSGIKGIILESFGCGNIPSNRPDIIRALMDASDRDIVIVNCTQCQKGTVLDAYETGKVLEKANVISGFDLTPEAALTKLSYLLGKGLPSNDIRDLMKQSLRGELSLPQVDKFSQKFTAIETVLESVFNINKSMSNQDTLKKGLYPSLFLSACSINNHIVVLSMLEEFDPDTHWLLNASDYDMRTPLHVACTKGHLSMVELLLRFGALVHVKDGFGHTCLYYALKHRSYSLVDVLVNSGAKLALPIMTSKTINDSKINHIQEIDVVDHRVADMLLEAIIEQDMVFIQKSVLCGVDLNTGNVEGKTPLHIACHLNRTSIAKYLLENGCNKDIKDIYGLVPLEYCTNGTDFAALLQN